MTSYLALALVALAAALALRALWRSRRAGKGACGGDCAHCKGCH